jgi:phosphotransferase system IIA component
VNDSSIIQEGQKVKAGDLLVQIDRNYLAEHKKDDIVIVVWITILFYHRSDFSNLLFSKRYL